VLCPSCHADAGDHSTYCPACGTIVVRPGVNDEHIGQVLQGKYKVEALIGEGGMGKVYRARQTVLDKPVVLKVLRSSLLSDERTVARFQREAKAASRLNHPNSISILDFGQDARSGALYIAMEYVAGKDLHQVLSREWPLPEARVVKIVVQVLSALADAHGAGVIHRDLKPENIMVENRRGEDVVKVLDFGIAKIQDASGEEGPALTRAGFVCGTPEYMSPEQARGGPIDSRSDLYAVGVILYQLTTGVLPFESDSAVGFATKHLTAEPPPPSRRRPDARISQGLERVILKALAKDPNDRPQTADAFRTELQGLLETRPRAQAARRAPPHASLARKGTPEEQAATKVDAAPAGRRKPQPGDSESSMVTVAGTAVTDPAGRGREPKTRIEAALSGPMKWVLAGLGVMALGAVLFLVFGSEPEKPAAPPPGDTPIAAQQELPLSTKPGDRLWEAPAPARAYPAAADELIVKGDAAFQRGQLDLATTHYKLAFQKDPRPDLSLRLGELSLRLKRPADAEGWWSRHLKDAPDSRARAYIRNALQNDPAVAR
jgi:serine/threonine protein kinase